MFHATRVAVTEPAEYLILRTDCEHATEADIEQWAADRGSLVTNIRRVVERTEFHGKLLDPPDDDGHTLWVADILISEGIE